MSQGTVESGRSPLVVSRAAAWMADWSMFVDEPDYQDPEVAIADGYEQIPLPPGALSVVGWAAELIPSTEPSEGILREWNGSAPVVVGTTLQVRLSASKRALLARFETADGKIVATERITVVDRPAIDGDDLEGRRLFRTGPIDLTRLRALCWSLGELDPERDWSWGAEPELVRLFAERLIAPGLVAGRAVVSGKHAPRRIVGITVRSANTRLKPDEVVCADVLINGATTNEVAVSCGGHRLADVTVQLRP